VAVYLLDTSVIIDALNDKKNRTLFLLNLVEQGHILACCPIHVAEVYAGLRPNEEPRTSQFLRSLQLFPIPFAVAELAGQIKRDHGRRGRTLALSDTLIAAVAIHNQLILLTDNTKDYPMKQLQLHPLP
jgi:predicted nucleic acid-binding protein